jgi:hypothetical protein
MCLLFLLAGFFPVPLAFTPWDVRLPLQGVRRTPSSLPSASTLWIFGPDLHLLLQGVRRTPSFLPSASTLWILFVHKLTRRLLILELDRDKLTKTKISAVIRSVSRWKNLAELFPTDATIEKIEKMEGELKHLMGALGAKVKVDPATAPGKHLHIFICIRCQLCLQGPILSIMFENDQNFKFKIF